MNTYINTGKLKERIHKHRQTKMHIHNTGKLRDTYIKACSKLKKAYINTDKLAHIIFRKLEASTRQKKQKLKRHLHIHS